MPSIQPAKSAALFRYPLKVLSPEPRGLAALQVAQPLPADRRYAIENGPSGFDPAAPAWMPKSQFLMLMRNERLAEVKTHFEDSTNLLTIRDGGKVAAGADLQTAESHAANEGVFAMNFPPDPKGPPTDLSGHR